VEDERGRLQVLKLITDVGTDGAALVEVLEHVRQSLPAHAGLLAVTEIGISDEGIYLASPVLSAPSVEGRLHGGRQSLDATLSWLRGVVAGVQAAHDAGVWHGAIHPRDVLVGDEGGVLTGMGVAPALEHVKLQAPVRVPYTAPERASGRAWDARADQYSLAMLALDALSGRRLIAGTIPAFDRWTLAETPPEDARLHDVFVRALHPEPDQRYPSLDAWLEALAGASAPGEEGALSRFAREGVILASAGAAAEAGREIEVQELEVSESPLALFPEEEGPTLSSPLPDGSRVMTEATAADAADADGEQEWLVAAVPDEPVEPATFESSLIVPVPVAVAIAQSEEAPTVTAHAEGEGARWSLDDADTSTVVAPPRSWDAVPDEGSGRRPLVLALVALLILALGYGTWRSLQGPAPVSTAREADDPAGAPDVTGPADASPDDTSGGAAAPPPPRSSPESADASRGERPLVPQGPVAGGASPAPQASRVPPAETPATAATPAEPSPGTGRALIRSSPSGEVQVNGRSRGETPVVLRDLPFGTYVVSISRPGFETVQREVSLLASQPVASLTVDLVRSGSAPAEASTRPLSQGGTLPPTAAPATAPTTGPTTGPAAASAPAGAETSAATPASQNPAAIQARPAPADGPTGGIFVVSTPAQARLFIDGQLYGSTPAAIPGLTPGPHRVRIESRGFRTWEGQVLVTPGARVRVQATLQQEQE
jgi:hypothetical protein